MTIRLVAVDMDGTFLHSDDTYDRDRFARLRGRMDGAGVRFVVASGNQYEQLRSFFDAPDQLGFVADNGAYVIDAGEVVAEARIAPEAVIAVAELLEADGIPYLASGPGRAFVPDWVPEDFYRLMTRYYHSLQRVADIRDVRDRVFKFALFDERGLPADLEQRLAAAVGEAIVPVNSGHGSMDLGAPGIHKAAGLRVLLDRWGIDPADVAAFGDSANDLEMLRLAGTGVATANAADVVREACDHHTDSNNDDGVLNRLDAWFGKGTAMAKILFIDIDGTLVDYHNHLPASAVAAIRQAREAGHQVLLCSGRAKPENPDEVWDIGVDGYVGGNGNYVEHHDQVVFANAISPEDCRAIVDWLRARGLEFYLETNAGLFASEDFGEAAVPAMEIYSARKGRPAPKRDKVVFHGMTFDGPWYRDDVMKLSYLLNSYADHLAAVEAFPHLQHGTWGGRGAEALFGDIGVTGVTKAVAVQAILDHLGADRADTIAFGDATVDIPMFEECGYGVAMGNASQDLKDVANLVTTDVEEDGLANAFATLGLIPAPDAKAAPATTA